MAPRTRTSTLSRPKGIGRQNNVNIGGGTIQCGVSTISDQTGPGDNAPLNIDTWYFEGGVINKTATSSFVESFDNYTCDVFNTPANFPHGTIPGLLSNAAYAAKLAARTNPSRAYVDVPVVVSELGDVISLIRSTGRGVFRNTHYRRAGNINLSYQFGLLPMISDIRKILNFQEQVDRRVAEIKRLSGPKGLRRTVQLDVARSIATTSKSFQSNYLTINMNCRRESSQIVRGHVRWRPDPSHPLPKSGSAEFRNMIRRTVLGLHVDSSTLWEAIPWTWLIDWGTNIGTYLKAQRNFIPCLPPDIHIMRRTDTDWTWNGKVVGASNPGFCSGGFFHRSAKTRSSAVPALTAQFPFLSGNQLGIVASLAVTRL